MIAMRHGGSDGSKSETSFTWKKRHKSKAVNPIRADLSLIFCISPIKNGVRLYNYDYFTYIMSGALSAFNVNKRHAVQIPYKFKIKTPYSIL